MSRYVLIFFVVAVLVCMAQGNPVEKKPMCGQNEVYTDCGTACQPSCKNRNPICTMQCVAGCQCIKGMLRNKHGECVDPCDC